MEEANEKENENTSGVSSGNLEELEHLISSSETQLTVF